MMLQTATNQNLTLEWTDGKGSDCKMTGLAHTVSMGGTYDGYTEITLEVQGLKYIETEAKLEKGVAPLGVSRTAAIVVKELTVANFKEAQRLAGAPDEAIMSYLAQTSGGFKVTFTWTD